MIDDAAPTPVRQPNIVLITTDQQHHRLAGYAGDRYVRTPALDRLAREGTRFEMTYAANPVCVPSRYSLLTGHLPHRFGGLETNQQSNANTAARHHRLGVDAAHGPVSARRRLRHRLRRQAARRGDSRRSRPRRNSGSDFTA